MLKDARKSIHKRVDFFSFEFMEWQDLAEDIYFKDGSLRDIYVHNTSKSDWLKWAVLVNENYPVAFYNGKQEISTNRIDIESVFDESESTLCNAVFFLGYIQLNTHFFTEEEIEHDLDPASIKSPEHHTRLMEYMITLSKVLGKNVDLTIENMPEVVLLSTDDNSRPKL